MKWSKTHPGAASFRRFFYPLLVLAAVWDLAGDGVKNIRFFSPSSVEGENVCQLDCFSAPSVAAAILKQEAEHLLGTYIRTRDAERETTIVLPTFQGLGRTGTGQPVSRNGSSLDGSGRNSAVEASIIRSMERLDEQVHELRTDLDRKLMTVYSRGDLWNEFLDRYLRFLHEAPENLYVVTWARCALDCSQRCGRTDEVVQALQEAIRLHADLGTATGIRSILAEWGGEEQRSLATADQ